MVAMAYATEAGKGPLRQRLEHYAEFLKVVPFLVSRWLSAAIPPVDDS